MAYISVNFGYNQSKLFSTNCQVAPLLDSIHEECYKEMLGKLVEREEFFNKEITGFKKEQAGLEKKLEKLDLIKQVQTNQFRGQKKLWMDSEIEPAEDLQIPFFDQ